MCVRYKKKKARVCVYFSVYIHGNRHGRRKCMDYLGSHLIGNFQPIIFTLRYAIYIYTGASDVYIYYIDINQSPCLL